MNKKLSIFLLAALATCGHAAQTVELVNGTISSGSMVPTILVGDHVYVIPYNYDLLKPGDIVAYRPAFLHPWQDSVTHRLTRKRGEYWCVKGDANAREDSSFMTRDNFVGLVLLQDKTSMASPSSLLPSR